MAWQTSVRPVRTGAAAGISALLTRTRAAITRPAAAAIPNSIGASRAWPLLAAGRPIPRAVGGLTAIVHPGVLHAEDGGVLGLEEATVDDLADEQGVVPAYHLLADLALEPRRRLVQDRHSGDRPVVEGEAVERTAVAVELGRLHELA